MPQLSSVPNQHILDAHDFETNMNKTVIALHGSVSSMLVFCATGQNLIASQKTLDDIASTLDEQITSRLSPLIGYYHLAQRGNRVSPNQRNALLSDARVIIKHSFDLLHERFDLQMSPNEDTRTKVFLSYSHKDEK